MQHAGGSVLPSSVSRALIILADLTEYYKLGGAPGHDLSYMIERGDVCSELVNARRAQLRLYFDPTSGSESGCRNRLPREFNPQIVHFLGKQGLFVQHVGNERELIVPRAGCWILRETCIQLERLLRKAS